MVFFLTLFPIFTFAAFAGPCPNGTYNNGTACVPNQDPNTGLVPCYKGEACNYGALIILVDNLNKFIFEGMVIPIAAIMMAYAGFLLVTAGGEAAGARTKAKTIFWNAVFGLIIAMTAWLIVKLILTTLNYTGPGL